MSTHEPQKRIFLWGTMRSLSSAFLRAMINRPGTKGFLEPYWSAYYFGSDRVSARYADMDPKPNRSFADIKALCEQDYPGYDVVFVKDIAHLLAGRIDTSLTYLPAGFKHTFLIRDPVKVIKSQYRMFSNENNPAWTEFLPSEFGFVELYQMYRFVTEELGQPAIVIDADDLLQQPEIILRKYCSAVGISFHDQMLNWSTESQYVKPFAVDEMWSEWFSGVLKYNSFQTPPQTKNSTVSDDLPENVTAIVEESKPIYKAMYVKRIKPQC